ncbi:MAG TPA: collagen-like protein [Actinomycetales bacterium]|nr:collagen-like protein [Actinomycetales bacterium]
MNQPPYGDQGYGPNADPNEPGDSNGGQGPHGNPGEPSQPGPYGNQGQSGPYGNPGGPDQSGAYGNPGNQGHPGSFGNQGQPGPYGNPGQPGQPNGPGGGSKANFLDSLKGGVGGMPPKTLAIIGGAILLVIILLLVIVFGVFGDSEERDRKAVVKAANEYVDTMRDGDKFSDLNDLLCSRNQADEDVAEEIDEEMAAMGYTLAELFELDGELDGVEITERDVEFTSDQRRQAEVYIDDYTQTFRHIDGDWKLCSFGFSDIEADDLF